jgi:hypothetical protein
MSIADAGIRAATRAELTYLTALARARTLESDLGRAVHLGGISVNDLDLALEVARALRDDLALASASGFGLRFARERARGLIHNLEHFRRRASDTALHRAWNLSHDRARALESDLVFAYELANDHDIARYYVRDLERALAHTRALDRTIDRALVRARGHDGGQSRARQVASSAARLLAAAVWLLPAARRCRYAEEYRSELWDLAQAGDGRIRQWRYAFCQLRSALSMSVTLRSPRRRNSAP